MMWLLLVAVITAHQWSTVTARRSSIYLVPDDEKDTLAHGKPDILARQASGTVEALVTQNPDQLEYLINITVGTPPQHLFVSLDTGSSDLWIPSIASPLCQGGGCDGGQFDANASSSYHIVSVGGFDITYAAPNDSDIGDWATDTVTLGNSLDIVYQQVGVAVTNVDPHGVIGLGYDTNEARNVEGVYPTILDNMLTQGLIARKAYSLYLNDIESNSGSIVFGGIDPSKYTGELIALPVQPDPRGRISQFFVTLTNVTVTNDEGYIYQISPENYAQSVLLDSGTTFTMLSDNVYVPLAEGFGAGLTDDNAMVIPCDYNNLKGSINYQFGGTEGPVISVPISDIVGPQVYTSTAFESGSGGCEFGIEPPLYGVSILGDSFMRAAYVVFDLQNNVVALAQAVPNASAFSDIAIIPSGIELPGVRRTASATGTQLSAAQLSMPDVPIASVLGTTQYVAGSPTFGLQGVAPIPLKSSTSTATWTSIGACKLPQHWLVLRGLISVVAMVL